MASVIVVGAGLRGLVCAARLTRAGYEVEVLEREPGPVGSAGCEPRLAFPTGGHSGLSLRGDVNLALLLEALGLGSAQEPLHEPAFGILREGRIAICDPRTPARLLATSPLGTGARLRLLALGLDLVRLRRLLDPARPERAAPLDGRAASTRLRRRAGEEAWTWLVAPALAAATRTAPESLSEAAALLAMRRAAGGIAPRRLAGGVQRLVAALAAGVSVRSGCDVVRVETETDGARVRYERGGRPRSVLADAVVLAIPGTAVVPLCPKLTPDERGFFEMQGAAPQLEVKLLLDRPPAVRPPSLLLLPQAERLGLASAVFDAAAVPGAAGLLAVALDEPAARELREAPDAAVVAHALGGLARTPLGRLEVAHALVRRSARTGCGLAPGSLRRLAAFATRIERSPRLVFTAELATGPGLEAAVTAGMRAATQVARAL